MSLYLVMACYSVGHVSDNIVFYATHAQTNVSCVNSLPVVCDHSHNFSLCSPQPDVQYPPSKKIYIYISIQIENK